MANTGVVHWGGKTLALYERDLPYELSSPDLRTAGQTVQVPSEAPYFGAVSGGAQVSRVRVAAGSLTHPTRARSTTASCPRLTVPPAWWLLTRLRR